MAKKDRNDRDAYGDKLQKRIKTGQKNSGGRKKTILLAKYVDKLVTLADGRHIMDILAYIAGAKDLYSDEGDPTHTYEYWAHTQVGPNNAMVLCPAEMFDDPCPICEDRQELREKGKDKERWVKLFPKRRNMYNIILYDKGEKKKGVQILDVSWHYLEKSLLAISVKTSRKTGREETINFAHPKNGRSLEFSIEPAKTQNDYPSWVGHKLESRDYDIDKKLMKKCLKLDECVIEMEYDEIKKLYHGGKSNKDEDGDERPGGKSGKDSDPDDDLDDLLEELEDLDDMDDLEEFIDDNNLDVKIKKKDDEDDVKEKIQDALKEALDPDEDPDDELDEDDIKDMSKKELKKLIKEKDLNVDPKDADDLEDLQEMVIDELDL